MKKLTQCIALIFAFCFSMSFFVFLPKSSASASTTTSQDIATVLSPNFASKIDQIGINANEVDEFTPFNTINETRYGGNSYSPELKGSTSYKYINSTIKVDDSLIQYESETALNSANLALELWIEFDLKTNVIPRALTIKLQSEDEQNYVSWVLDVNTIKDLTNRSEASSNDLKIFGTKGNVPIGWVKINLPFANGSITGTVVDGKTFNISKLKIEQTTEENSDQPLSFYNIKIIKKQNNSDGITSEIQSYSQVVIKPSAKVLDSETKYYIGEIFPQFLTANSVYNECWIGRTNYLDLSNYNNLKIKVDTTVGNSSATYYAYGAGDFVIKSSTYTISYGVMYNGKFFGFLSDKIYAENYGKGVWIESESDDIEIGQTKKLYYKIHSAFSNATIEFFSSDENILKIKEVNTINNYILVESISKGTATIKILVRDDRLAGTEYEDSGLLNTDFKIDVVKETKKANTTSVVLWIGFGILSAGLIYLAIKAIIDVRKIEIK